MINLSHLKLSAFEVGASFIVISDNFKVSSI